MKTFIFKVLLDLVRIEATLLGFVYSVIGRRGVGVALLEPCPTSKFTNGDEALIYGACRFLSESGSGTVEILTFTNVNIPEIPVNAAHGGSLYNLLDSLPRKLLRYFEWPLLLSRYDHVYIIGADLIDGYYAASISDLLFRLADMASRTGAKTSLISCSFNDSAPVSIRASMRKYLRKTRVNARDKYSADRLSRFLGREVSYSADVAFGLEAQESKNTAAIHTWITSERALGRKIVALNINLMPIVMMGDRKVDEFVGNWVDWINEIVAAGNSVVLLPHDYRGDHSDEVAAATSYGRLSGGIRDHCHLPSCRLHAAEIKKAVDACDLVVTGRMHLAIAAMGVGVPVVAYAYQGKFEGILGLFGLEGHVRSIGSVFNDVQGEIDFARLALSNSTALSQVVRENITTVLELARRNVA